MFRFCSTCRLCPQGRTFKSKISGGEQPIRAAQASSSYSLTKCLGSPKHREFSFAQSDKFAAWCEFDGIGPFGRSISQSSNRTFRLTGVSCEVTAQHTLDTQAHNWFAGKFDWHRCRRFLQSVSTASHAGFPWMKKRDLAPGSQSGTDHRLLQLWEIGLHRILLHHHLSRGFAH